jgi:hypothetical protein
LRKWLHWRKEHRWFITFLGDGEALGCSRKNRRLLKKNEKSSSRSLALSLVEFRNHEEINGKFFISCRDMSYCCLVFAVSLGQLIR